MKRLCALSLGVLALASSALAQIPLTSIEVRGSDPAVLRFPTTATLESFGVGNGRMAIRTTGTDRWPAVSIDGTSEPNQSATLWVFLNIGGQWFATGAERLRPNQVNGDKPEGSPSDLIGTGWLYAADRWREMSGYNPRPGERIGVMVVAGSTRSDNNTPVKERTNILEILWPGPEGAHPATVVWNEAAPPVVPPPVVVPPIVPLPAPPVVTVPPVVVVPPVQPPSADLSNISAQLAQLIQLEIESRGMIAEIRDTTRTFKQQLASVMMFVTKYLAAPLTAWILARQMQ